MSEFASGEISLMDIVIPDGRDRPSLAHPVSFGGSRHPLKFY